MESWKHPYTESLLINSHTLEQFLWLFVDNLWINGWMSGSANNLEIPRQVKSMFFKRIFHIIWSSSHQNKEERKSLQKMYDISRFPYFFHFILLVENCFFPKNHAFPVLQENFCHDLRVKKCPVHSVGQLVYLHQPDSSRITVQSRKLRATWVGPFAIHECLDRTQYTWWENSPGGA
jgi:hypothetical protein